MGVAAAVVRWAVLAVVWAGAAQGTGLVDISRCKDSCSSVPEDLWPSCCEVHNTCCQEFAESCMHDCLPRVHTGDVSVVEERPGMCCALYNLCCFRETFRISSKGKKQDPVSFPIVHRFHVQPPSQEEASRFPSSRPPTRPSFSSFSHPQLSKKPLRPDHPDGFKKLSGDDGDNTDESKKPRSRPKFSGFLGNRNVAEERRKLADQGESGSPSESKVTRRPAGSDIRQEIFAPEVGAAEPMGSRRLDASINPVVTRKRLLLANEERQAARSASKKEEPEERTPRGRNLQNTPAREGRTLGVGRSSIRPAAPQQASGRAQAAVVAGRENPRPSTRRPTQAPPTPPVRSIQDNTPKITVEEKVSAAPAIVQIPEPLKQSKSPAAEEETNDPIDSIIDALQQAHDTSAASTVTSPEQSPATEENHVGEASQPEVVVKVPETPAGAEEKTEAETEADTADPVKTAANIAFSPPEIVVNTPEEPKVTKIRNEDSPATEDPTQERKENSRSRSSAREQSSGADASQTQSQSGNPTQGRNRASSRDQTGDRAASRTANQAAVRGTTNTARQSQTRDRSRTQTRSQAADEAAPVRTSRTRG